MSWKNVYTIDLKNGVKDITENDEYYIVRETNGILFIDKRDYSLQKRVDIPVDHELGHGRIQANNAVCVTVVFAESRSSGEEFLAGNPHKGFLKAFDIHGEKWSYELSSWTIRANYGGFYLYKDTLLIQDSGPEGPVTILLDAVTGNTISRKASSTFQNINSLQLGVKNAVHYSDKVIFSVFENSYVLKGISDSNSGEQVILEQNPILLTQNSRDVYFHSWWDDGLNIYTYNKDQGKITHTVGVDESIYISLMESSNDGSRIIIADDKKRNVTCFNSLDMETVWEKDIDVFDMKLDRQDHLFIFSKNPDPRVLVLDLKTGEILFQITEKEHSIGAPLFVLDDILFVSNSSQLYMYER